MVLERLKGTKLARNGSPKLGRNMRTEFQSVKQTFIVSFGNKQHKKMLQHLMQLHWKKKLKEPLPKSNSVNTDERLAFCQHFIPSCGTHKKMPR